MAFWLRATGCLMEKALSLYPPTPPPLPCPYLWGSYNLLKLRATVSSGGGTWLVKHTLVGREGWGKQGITDGLQAVGVLIGTQNSSSHSKKMSHGFNSRYAGPLAIPLTPSDWSAVVRHKTIRLAITFVADAAYELICIFSLPRSWLQRPTAYCTSFSGACDCGMIQRQGLKHGDKCQHQGESLQLCEWRFLKSQARLVSMHGQSPNAAPHTNTTT